MRKDSAGQRLLAAHYRVDGQPHINTIQVIKDTWIMNNTCKRRILNENDIINNINNYELDKYDDKSYHAMQWYKNSNS